MPDAKGIAYLLVLTGLGILGNHLNIEMFFGVNILFGSVATMIAVRASGTLWGTIVGIAIGSYTYFLWGHPYAIYIFGLEAFVVGITICVLKKDNMILAGIGNVVIANILLQWTPIGRMYALQGKSKDSPHWSLRSATNNVIALFILVPVLGTMTISNLDELEEIQTNLNLHVRDGAWQGVSAIQSTLHSNTFILKSLIESDFKSNESQEWPTIIEKWGLPLHSLF